MKRRLEISFVGMRKTRRKQLAEIDGRKLSRRLLIRCKLVKKDEAYQLAVIIPQEMLIINIIAKC